MAAGESKDEPLRILLVLRSLRGYLRFFGAPIEEMVRRGHHVHLVVEMLESDGTFERSWLSDMEEHEGFSWEWRNLLRRDRWYKPSKAVRQSLDYVRVLGPEFEGRPYFRRRGEGRSSDFIQRLMSPRLMRTRPVLSIVARILAVIDSAMPVGREVRRYLDACKPDVLMLSPHLPPGSLHSTYVWEAQKLGVPVAMCVASWDNLSSKQLIRSVPERLLVWNETQREEAALIHGIDPDRVTVTGAQVFDHWFDWKPRQREEFLTRAGLDPGKPYVLYVGGALMEARRTEAQWFAQDWLPRLRAADDPLLSGANVLVRPHPKRSSQWAEEAVDLREGGGVVVFPAAGLKMPLEARSQADYFDSIYHSAAVVGLNSTAMIEAAIPGRPVLTMLLEEFYDSQEGTFHFDYLMKVAGGVVQPARTFEEHHAQLRKAIIGEDPAATERAERFVRAFVRPLGLDRAATPALVDAVEETANLRSELLRPPVWVRPVRTAVIAAVYLANPGELWRGVTVRVARLRRAAA